MWNTAVDNSVDCSLSCFIVAALQVKTITLTDIPDSKREKYTVMWKFIHISSGISSYIRSSLSVAVKDSFPLSSSLVHVVIASFFAVMVSYLFWDCGTLVPHEDLVVFTSALKWHWDHNYTTLELIVNSILKTHQYNHSLAYKCGALLCLGAYALKAYSSWFVCVCMYMYACL